MSNYPRVTSYKKYNILSPSNGYNPPESTAAGHSAVIIVLQTDKSVKLVSPVQFSVRYRHRLTDIYSTVWWTFPTAPMRRPIDFKRRRNGSKGVNCGLEIVIVIMICK